MDGTDVAIVAGIVVAWVALRRLADSGGELVGRGATLIGLALSITFLMIAPSRHVAVSWYLHREARPCAERWFELLANDQPFTFLYVERRADALRRSLQGVAPDFRGELADVGSWWLLEGAP